jgi:SPP1 family predicted phage head-tail adaptor
MRIGTAITNPGFLRVRGILKRRSPTVDPGGFQKEALTTIAIIWGKWVGVHGSEAWAANSANALRGGTYLIRYRDDVDETCVITLDGLDYEIVSMDDIQLMHEYIELKLQLIRSG